MEFKTDEAKFYKTIRDNNAKDFKDIWLFIKDIEQTNLRYNDGEVIDAKWVTIEELEEMKIKKEVVPTLDFTKNDYYKLVDNLV